MPGPAEGDCRLFTFMFGSQCLYQVMLLNSTTCQQSPCMQPLTHAVFHTEWWEDRQDCRSTMNKPLSNCRVENTCKWDRYSFYSPFYLKWNVFSVLRAPPLVLKLLHSSSEFPIKADLSPSTPCSFRLYLSCKVCSMNFHPLALTILSFWRRFHCVRNQAGLGLASEQHLFQEESLFCL